MKAFGVFLAILLHSLLGVAIACPLGFKGPDCEEKCTMECNSGQCDWRNETQVCICEETKYTGANCEETLPCASAKCNHGRCEPSNITLFSFNCVCDVGYEGDLCDRSVIDLCFGQSKLACVNDAPCVDNKCVCKDGFGGELCQNRVPLLSEYESSRCSSSCAAIFGNNKCNSECDTAECFYDGLDCYKEEHKEHDDIWIEVDSSSVTLEKECLAGYGNDRCNKDCNSETYGFDGGDCDKEVRGTVTSKIQISLGVNPTEVNLSLNFLLAYLAQILRAVVSISKSTDNKDEVFSIVSATGVEERITLDDSLPNRFTDFTKLILDVDASYCSRFSCLQLNGTEKTIQPAIVFLDTLFVREDRNLSFPSRSRMVFFTVQDVVVPEEPSAAWIEIFVTVIISMSVTLLFALLLIACWLVQRRRRYSKTAKDGGARHRWIDHHKNRLVAAVEEGNVSSLTSLLSETTPIDAANAEDESGNTVLHMAAARDDKEVVQLLLQSMMFDVCSVNSIGQSPLLYSLREGKPSLETLKLLVNAINEAKLRQRTTNQGTPRAAPSHLMLTALSEEPGWGLTDAVGRSALHLAALAGRPRDIIHFLVSHGASPGLQDASGNTPLHLASINGHSETVNALLDERSSVTITNSMGNTPAKVCELNGHVDLAALLFEREHAVGPLRPRHDSQRGTMYSTVESVFSDEPDDHEVVLPSLLSFNAFNAELAASSVGASENGCDGGGGGRLSVSGLGGGGGPNSTFSGSMDALLQTTPRPSLPHILTPSSQLVEVSPERENAVPSTLPRKCLYGVERSPSDPRPSQLTTPYGSATFGKRRSLPDGPSIAGNYRDVLLSPVHFTYASNTMSTTSERSQSSAGNDSLVSTFRPPPLS